MTGDSGHVVIVVSPLLSLIQDQSECFRQLGISCISLSNVDTQEEIHLVESGSYLVVYLTPESLLKKDTVKAIFLKIRFKTLVLSS